MDSRPHIPYPVNDKEFWSMECAAREVKSGNLRAEIEYKNIMNKISRMQGKSTDGKERVRR